MFSLLIFQEIIKNLFFIFWNYFKVQGVTYIPVFTK